MPFIVLGGAVGIEGRRRFVATQAAMRAGAPLEPPHVVRFLPFAIAAVAAIAVVGAVAELVASA